MTNTAQGPLHWTSLDVADQNRRQLPPGFTPPCHLLIIDIDGTLLNSQKEITARTADALRDLSARGLPVAFATGRMWEAVAAWAHDMGFVCPQIANNGADVVDPSNDRRLCSICLNTATVNFLLDRGRDFAMRAVLFSGKRVLGRGREQADILIERNNEYVEPVSETILRSPETQAEKIVFLTLDRPDELFRIREQLLQEAEKVPDVAFSVDVTETGILNFCHLDARKFCAAVALAEHLGTDLSHVIAVGDGDNDAELLAAVGLGIAMGNAAERARAAADLVVPDNDHDGLAWAIEHVVKPAMDPGRGLARDRSDG